MRFLEQSDPKAPWKNARIFNSRIRRNIKLAEAPSFGQSIFDYAAKSPGALDYAALMSRAEDYGPDRHFSVEANQTIGVLLAQQLGPMLTR